MSARVLIVEDEPHIVESLSFIIDRAGFAVAAVSDGETAVERIRAAPPDVVVLDVMLPKRNGFEILKWIRSEPHLEDVRVLLLTAKGQEQDRKTAQALGADAFVTKPFANADLVASIRRLVASPRTPCARD